MYIPDSDLFIDSVTWERIVTMANFIRAISNSCVWNTTATYTECLQLTDDKVSDMYTITIDGTNIANLSQNNHIMYTIGVPIMARLMLCSRMLIMLYSILGGHFAHLLYNLSIVMEQWSEKTGE